jgi:endonuclease-3
MAKTKAATKRRKPGRKKKPRESIDDRKARAKNILGALRKAYGADTTTALAHENALHLLIATILSAQSTDETINRLTPGLFRKYPNAKVFADAPRDELEADIRPSGFFRNKAKAVQGACRMIVERFDGEVPCTMEGLLELPGVARKTANVVLGTWFRKNEGVVVDTHVGRLAERLGLTWTGRNAKDAVRIEEDLMALWPRASWTFAAHALIWHGRRVCTARKPACDRCVLASYCPSAGTFA